MCSLIMPNLKCAAPTTINRLHLLTVSFLIPLFVVLTSASESSAGALVEGFAKARQFDPLYLSALAERESNQVNAKVARSAYYPQMSISQSQLQNESSPRRTLTLSQPIFNADRLSTMFEGKPRDILAEATFSTREQDLALRLIKAVGELVRARENLKLNKAKINALEQQAQSSKRLYDLGQGTITDLRDTQVRLAQARATDLSLRARTDAAERQFQAITGYQAAAGAFLLAERERPLVMSPLEEQHARVLAGNPAIITARQNMRMGELAAWKSKGALMPLLSATVNRTEISGQKATYAGIELSYPLNAGGFLQIRGANANVARLRELARDAEEHAKMEIERLRGLVLAGQDEVAIRREAIEAAELSAEANEKSFRGGVRTRVDVLNAIQVVFQTQQDYVESSMTMAENLLSLHLQLATPVPEAFKEIEDFIF